MTTKQAARQRLLLRRANLSTVTDKPIIANFEHTCTLLVPVFGIMWAVIAMLIISGAVI